MIYRVVIDWMGKPHTSNDERKMNRYRVAEAHREWREAALQAARLDGLPKNLLPCRVHAHAVYPKGNLPDTGAIAPTVKCIIDGLVDHGCWPDDSGEWVVSEVYHPAVRVSSGGRYAVVVVLEEVQPDDPPPPR